MRILINIFFTTVHTMITYTFMTSIDLLFKGKKLIMNVAVQAVKFYKILILLDMIKKIKKLLKLFILTFFWNSNCSVYYMTKTYFRVYNILNKISNCLKIILPNFGVVSILEIFRIGANVMVNLEIWFFTEILFV